MKTSLVHVDIAQVERLAGRLGRFSEATAAMADRLSALGGMVDVDVAARRGLRDLSAWAGREQAGLRKLIVQVQRLEASGQLGGAIRITRRGGPAFADPVEAHRAADRALELLADPGDESSAQAAALLRRHGRNPVFGAVLLHGLGENGVAAILHRAVRRWADPDAVERPLVHGLGQVLATTMARSVAPFGWTELRDASGEQPTGERGVGLLFTGPAIFGAPALLSAGRHLVAPLNRAVRQHPGAQMPTVHGPRGLIDVRAVILRRMAVDAGVARSIVATSTLDELAAAELGYADGGAAVAELLIAGTTPLIAGTTPHVSDTGPLAVEPLITGQGAGSSRSGANLQKVVGWLAGPVTAPVMVERGIGRMLTPWIGSIRGAGLDGAVERHVRLDEADARRVLTRGMRFEATRNTLVGAAWRWAGDESRRLASRPVRGPGYDAIGSVLGIVTTEGHDARAEGAARYDLERDRQRALWAQVQGTVTKPLPAVGRAVVSTVARPVKDELLPDTTRQLDHWAEQRDPTIGHEALALEYLVLGTLWEQRAANGYFRGPTAAPPSALLRGDGASSSLRPLVSLDAPAVEDYYAWRSRLAAGRAAPVQLAVERFLAEGREAPA